MARTIQCIKLGQEAEGLDFPPYPGDLGKRIWESVSKQAWADWLKHQTMLVNENRLNLAKKMQNLATETHFIRLAIVVPIGCRTLLLESSAMALFDEVSPLANFGR